MPYSLIVFLIASVLPLIAIMLPLTWRRRILIASAIYLTEAVLWIGLIFLATGGTPREYIASWIYPEVGFAERYFEPGIQKIEFQNRIFAKRFYSLEFVVHTTHEDFGVALNKMRRMPSGDPGVCGEPSTFNVIVRKPSGEALYNETITAFGTVSSGYDGPVNGTSAGRNISREIVAIVFDPGLYEIAVTPVGDFSKFKSFSSSFSLYFRTHPKTGPIFSDQPAAMEERRPVSRC